MLWPFWLVISNMECKFVWWFLCAFASTFARKTNLGWPSVYKCINSVVWSVICSRCAVRTTSVRRWTSWSWSDRGESPFSRQPRTSTGTVPTSTSSTPQVGRSFGWRWGREREREMREKVLNCGFWDSMICDCNISYVHVFVALIGMKMSRWPWNLAETVAEQCWTFIFKHLKVYGRVNLVGDW